eukprot:scaffold47306_cov20-Prasinocladus_malaysianus.AAC.1
MGSADLCIEADCLTCFAAEDWVNCGSKLISMQRRVLGVVFSHMGHKKSWQSGITRADVRQQDGGNALCHRRFGVTFVLISLSRFDRHRHDLPTSCACRNSFQLAKKYQ